MLVMDIHNVTLASADPALLLFWENMVRQGTECSLLLKHSKGKIITILKSTGPRIFKQKDPSPTPPDSTPAEKKKKKKRGNKQKRLEALLSYHQRLVQEKGLPPSKLMLQHAVALTALPVQAEQEESILFHCDQCDFITNSQQGVIVHKGIQHQEQQKPVVQDEERNDEQNEIEHFKCDHCEYTTYSKHGLAVHIGIRHKEMQKPDFFHEEAPLSRKFSRCTFCRERFDSKEEFRAHMFSEIEYVKCPLCDLFHSNCQNLQEHMKEKHDRDLSFTVREYNK